MRKIDADALQKVMESVTNDPTCPMHIAATIDQIIDCAPTVDDWIPCRERMPDCGGVYIAGSEFVTGVVEYSERAAAEGQFPFGHVNYYTDEDGGRKAEWVECKWVTHWAPFPDFPKEDHYAG
ncbi:MAG: DUF551 domain-containing protein [Oscillospiraceae bacterium]|nr:DUF551 domain-containing protein [Oscillospiraceae bacterium]